MRLHRLTYAEVASGPLQLSENKKRAGTSKGIRPIQLGKLAAKSLINEDTKERGGVGEKHLMQAAAH